jgi:hypothetical protein
MRRPWFRRGNCTWYVELENGKQVNTGRSSELNAQFARNFTQHYDALAVKYPVYAELRNIFDLALVAGLIEQHRLGDDDRCERHGTAVLVGAASSVGGDIIQMYRLTRWTT